jgi:hypothetical protein
MVAAGFAKAVVKGLQIQGFSETEVARAAGVTVGKLKAGALKEQHLLKIEAFCGHTVGELAARAVEPRGGPCTEFAEMWARAVPPKKPVAKKRRSSSTPSSSPAASRSRGG